MGSRLRGNDTKQTWRTYQVQPFKRTARGETMNEIMVGELSDFVEGGYRVLRVDSFEFGIFRQGDRLLAYENQCPHDGGPVCQGKVIPRVEEELAPDQTSRGLRFAKSRNIVCPGTAGSSTSKPAATAAIPNIACGRSTFACAISAST